MRHCSTWKVAHALSLALALTACGGSGSGGRDASVDASTDGGVLDATDAHVEDLDMQASDFECVLRWQQVGHYRISNRLGHQAEAEAVASDPDGGTFPVGTVLQIVPNEAMVKRRTGFSTDTRDWEFFALSTSDAGTTILDRGTTQVANGFGGRCISCHALASPQFDLVCGETHGCDPLPFTAMQLESLQASDPRCP